MPREMKSSLVVPLAPYWRPGSRNAEPAPLFSAALPSRSEMLKSNFSSTRKVIRMVPPISSTALTIWTQVVPFMPPMVTYTIIRTPTRATMRILPASEVMPSSSETRMPAPAIWASR